MLCHWKVKAWTTDSEGGGECGVEPAGVVAHGNSPTVGLGGGVDQFSGRGPEPLAVDEEVVRAGRRVRPGA